MVSLCTHIHIARLARQDSLCEGIMQCRLELDRMRLNAAHLKHCANPKPLQEGRFRRLLRPKNAGILRNHGQIMSQALSLGPRKSSWQLEGRFVVKKVPLSFARVVMIDCPAPILSYTPSLTTTFDINRRMLLA